MAETVYAINLEANLELVNITMNGTAGKECEEPDRKNYRVIVKLGEDPANADGIEILQNLKTQAMCIHWFCRWICW